MGASRVAFVTIVNAVPGAERFHQLREALSVCGRQKGAALVALAVTGDEVREFFFEERKKDRRGTWLQEERVGEEVLGLGFSCSVDKRFKIARCVGDAGQHRRAN